MMIEVRNLKKSFGALSVLDGVNFSIEKGEAVTIIGVSGGGKSVLLKHPHRPHHPGRRRNQH